MMRQPYRDQKQQIGTCPDCGAPGVLLDSYEYTDPHWYDDSDRYSPPCPPPILTGWRCRLCQGAPKDPRAAICYVGNLILKELAKK